LGHPVCSGEGYLPLENFRNRWYYFRDFFTAEQT